MTPEQLADSIRGCLDDAVAAGELALDSPPDAVPVRPSPGPADADFTSPVALALPVRGVDARGCAEILAGRLRRVPDVAAVEVAGVGFLNVTVRLDALLRTARAAAATTPAPVRAPSPLDGAWEELAAEVGSDVARWVSASDPDGDPGDRDRGRLLSRTLDNAAFRVLFAHTRAGAALDAAAAYGIDWRARPVAGSDLAAAAGRPLLVAIATCVGARDAPGAEPPVLARRLAGLATAYLAFEATGTVVPLGDRAVEPGQVARLWLAAATRSQLAAGLAQLGISAPERI